MSRLAVDRGSKETMINKAKSSYRESVATYASVGACLEEIGISPQHLHEQIRRNQFPLLRIGRRTILPWLAVPEYLNRRAERRSGSRSAGWLGFQASASSRSAPSNSETVNLTVDEQARMCAEFDAEADRLRRIPDEINFDFNVVPRVEAG